jgi:hypothetical protein
MKEYNLEVISIMSNDIMRNISNGVPYDFK